MLLLARGVPTQVACSPLVAQPNSDMRAGKSAIHGWGAFAKAPHAAGDLVVEYVGALVRCSAADACERRLYNSLVGAGTYVFRLSERLCVDATRAGAAPADRVPQKPAQEPETPCACTETPSHQTARRPPRQAHVDAIQALIVAHMPRHAVCPKLKGIA